MPPTSCRHFLLWLAFLFSTLLPSTVFAYRPCVVDARSANDALVVIPANIRVPANAPSDSIIWTSANFNTSITCSPTGGSIYFVAGMPTIELPENTIKASVEWSITGDGGTTPDFPTSVNRDSQIDSRYHYNGPVRVITFVIRWRLVLRKGNAAATTNYSQLPASFTMFELSDFTGRDVSNTRFVLMGLNNIRATQTTCTTTVIPSSNVILPSVSQSGLATTGQSAGTTSFGIELSNCKDVSGDTANSAMVRTYFESPQSDSVTGNLKLIDANPAANVQLQLLNEDGSPINLAGNRGSQNVATSTINQGRAKLGYLVRYVTVGGPAGAGPTNSVVQFSMEYP